MATTTNTSATAWSPDLTIHHPGDVIPEALIMQTSTVAGRVEGDAPAVRVAYVDDAEATFTAEGADIPEADSDLDEALVFTGKISRLMSVSREQFHQEGTAAQLSQSVQRALARKANEAYLTQAAPTGSNVTPPAGILNIDGLETGDPIDGDMDALIDLIAGLESNGATPSHILIDPTGWATLRKLKTGEGANTALLGAGVSDAERRLLDLPVIVADALTENTGIILDSTAVVSAVGDIQIAQSEHLYFNSDSIALRATWRIGWNLVRPDRIGTFTIETGNGDG